MSIDLEREARAWMTDPITHFGMSNTRIHSTPRKEAEEIQLAALRIRFEERREQIPVLAKLADAQGIRSVESLDGAAPLLFEHNVYKSYPVSLLGRRRFDKLTSWLGRLTPYDLSGVDVSGCTSIDEWLETLQAETPLDVATSSGTSGTLSLFPKSKHDYTLSARTWRVQLCQRFGTEPTDAVFDEKIRILNPFYRDGHSTTGRFGHYFIQAFCHGDESCLHSAFPYKLSTDLMWLAGRLRAAAAKGDVTKIDVPESLLARRAELEEMQKNNPAYQTAWIRKMVDELKGQRVFAMGTTHIFYDVARRALDEGVRGVLTPDSVVMGGGGAKGMELPENVDEIILEFFGVPRMVKGYGMTELNSFSMTCEHQHYHFLPWLVAFVLDPDTGKPLPRSGVQSGRAAFFDMTHDGTWGGLVTGDQITVDWDTRCNCGRVTPFVEGAIQRFSELQGGDDKITCASTPDAQAEALDFLTSLEG